MTEVSIVVLALAFVVLCFNHFRLSFKVKELEELVKSSTEVKLLGRIKDLEELVDSHWAATQHECNGIWEAINGEENGDE